MPVNKSRHLIQVLVPIEMLHAIEQEAERLSTRKHKVTVTEVVRALIAAYIEKRLLGMVTHPDD